MNAVMKLCLLYKRLIAVRPSGPNEQQLSRGGGTGHELLVVETYEPQKAGQRATSSDGQVGHLSYLSMILCVLGL